MADATPSPPGLLDAPHHSGNGQVDEPFEAKLLADLDGAIREKRDAVLALEGERASLDERMAVARAALKRYEDTRKRLVGEPLKAGRKPGPKPPARTTPSRTSPEKMDQLREMILRYAEDHDEFAQVDIRTLPGSPVTHSGGIAHAFEQLRQDGFIRFARQDGLRKIYRLTRSAAVAQ
jgi:hypothetical protein